MHGTPVLGGRQKESEMQYDPWIASKFKAHKTPSQ